MSLLVIGITLSSISSSCAHLRALLIKTGAALSNFPLTKASLSISLLVAVIIVLGLVRTCSTSSSSISSISSPIPLLSSLDTIISPATGISPVCKAFSRNMLLSLRIWQSASKICCSPCCKAMSVIIVPATSRSPYLRA